MQNPALPPHSPGWAASPTTWGGADFKPASQSWGGWEGRPAALLHLLCSLHDPSAWKIACRSERQLRSKVLAVQSPSLHRTPFGQISLRELPCLTYYLNDLRQTTNLKRVQMRTSPSPAVPSHLCISSPAVPVLLTHFLSFHSLLVCFFPSTSLSTCNCLPDIMFI